MHLRKQVLTSGWEFAFELNELAKQVAAQSRVDVAFKKIPREVLDKKAVEQGDVHFFELGALSVDVIVGAHPREGGTGRDAPKGGSRTAYPRTDQGDSRAAYPRIDQGGSRTAPTVTLRLTDFIIPIDDIPVEVRKAVKHWSQMIDYWAVDWDYKGDTFHNQCQAYPTRKDPKIELEATHTYLEAGKYTVVVKVI